MVNGEVEFDEIHDAVRPKMLRYLTSVVGWRDAEDLTQEVFVKVDQALGAFRGEPQLSTWIYRIATNTALDKLRSPSFRQKGQKSLSEEPLPMISESFNRTQYSCFNAQGKPRPPEQETSINT